MPGPKPKPTTLKLLRGAHPSRVNKDEPTPLAGVPECPTHLSAEAKAEWDRILPQLTAMKVLTQADGDGLAAYCVVYARWLKAREAVSDKGLVVETPLGGVKPNPAVGISERCEAYMLRWQAEFGLTPSARSRIKIDTKQESELSAFLKTRPKKSG